MRTTILVVAIVLMAVVAGYVPESVVPSFGIVAACSTVLTLDAKRLFLRAPEQAKAEGRVAALWGNFWPVVRLLTAFQYGKENVGAVAEVLGAAMFAAAAVGTCVAVAFAWAKPVAAMYGSLSRRRN